MRDNKPTLRAQACRFRRAFNAGTKRERVEDWEPGIALLKEFGIPDVDRIIDSDGDAVGNLYTYELLQLRVDGYIAIEPYDYADKRCSPKDNTERADPAHDYR